MLGHDDELPRGFQDGDLEMADLVRQGIAESKLRKAGKCPHGWYKAPAGQKAKCNDCGAEFATEDLLLEERAERLGER